MESKELRYVLALSQLPGIGSVWGKMLIEKFEGPRNVFTHWKEGLKSDSRLAGIIREGIKDRAIWKRTDEELEFIGKFRLKVLYFQDPDYPQKLRDCRDSPMYLFYKGSACLNSAKIIGVVGTRSATDYGKSVTRELVSGLKGEVSLVVSGLAYGIDTCAHRAALDFGIETVGVLGHGMDRIYPDNNKTLAGKMLQQGGLVTEFFSRTLPDRENFPQRNRIIAGLCDAVIVVEAAGEGGALITADLADSYGRTVYAVPGRIGDLRSGGCNLLLKRKKAEVFMNAGDLLLDMGWRIAEEKPPPPLPRLFVPLTRDEEIIVGLLSKEGEMPVDEIVKRSGLSAGMTLAALLNLEIENVIKCKPGKMYSVSQAPAP